MELYPIAPQLLIEIVYYPVRLLNNFFPVIDNQAFLVTLNHLATEVVAPAILALCLQLVNSSGSILGDGTRECGKIVATIKYYTVELNLSVICQCLICLNFE